MYSCTSVFKYLHISVTPYFRISIIDYWIRPLPIQEYLYLYPTRLNNMYLHISVFPFSGIAVFPHSRIS